MTAAPWQGLTVRRPHTVDADRWGCVEALVNGTWRPMAITKAADGSFPWRHTTTWFKRQAQ